MVQKGRVTVEKNLETLVEKKKLSTEEQQAILKRLSWTSEIDHCVADLVIEAIIEQPEAKMRLFTQLAARNSPETILASNTSSLSLDSLATAIPRPERFIGMHFFNPAPLISWWKWSIQNIRMTRRPGR
jgi:3-hydroxybutyryl-CoA dehydrogenase